MVHEHDNVILGRALFESEYSPSILVLVAKLTSLQRWRGIRFLPIKQKFLLELVYITNLKKKLVRTSQTSPIYIPLPSPYIYL